jgi:hypothetical protein
MRRFLPRHVALAITDAHNPKTPPEATNSRGCSGRQIPLLHPSLNMRYTMAVVLEESDFCRVLPTGLIRKVVRTSDWVQAQVVLGITTFFTVSRHPFP